jgi:hypothetical protein
VQQRQRHGDQRHDEQCADGEDYRKNAPGADKITHCDSKGVARRR